MNIGELAERTGLTRSRIRFYEAKGLLRVVSRSGNGYRSYQPDAVLVLKLITTAQQAGFSLQEIAQILPADLSNWQHDEMMQMLQQKIGTLTEMIAQLEQSRRNLMLLVAAIDSKPAQMGCDENARRILAVIDTYGQALMSMSDQQVLLVAQGA
jgi:DNA-binding transcriptional MerR regulator